VARGTLTDSKEYALTSLRIARNCQLRLFRTEETNVANQIVNLGGRKREGRHLFLAFLDDVRDLVVGHAANLNRIHKRWCAVCALRIGAVANSAGSCK
jgi:hypothetical protein